MAKDNIRYLDTVSVSNILELAHKNNLELYQFYGSLQDNYFIINYGIRINKSKSRKYIIIEDNYLNEWSSNYKVTFTDNEDKFYSKLKAYEEEQEKQEQEAI